DYYDLRYLKPARNYPIKCYRACAFIDCKAFNADGSFVANAGENLAFSMSRKNPHIWNQAFDVANFCIKTLPEITFEHAQKSYNVCDKTEDFLQCVRANLPQGSSFDGLF
uniref:Odorant binding protein n=1 Tax=Musca domestica TaxID=7370 RepID=A0A1I8NKJ6_MUSDO